jgi:hypothetical protein
MKPEQNYLTRPESVKIALIILYVEICMQVLRAIFSLGQSLNIAKEANMPSPTMFISMLLSYGFYIFIIFMISRRKKWAWILQLIKTIFGFVVFMILLANKSSFLVSIGPSDLFLSILQHLALIAASILLIKKDSRKWFIIK